MDWFKVRLKSGGILKQDSYDFRSGVKHDMLVVTVKDNNIGAAIMELRRRISNHKKLQKKRDRNMRIKGRGDDS